MSRILITLHMCLLYQPNGPGLQSVTAGQCPPTRVIHPCRCSHDTVITCGEHMKYSLRHIFHDLSVRLPDRRSKHFRDFVFENTAIEEWEDSMFADITFENVTISNARNLAKIKSNSFNRTAKNILWFSQTGDTKLGINYLNQLFDALSSLLNVREISLDLPGLQVFPSYAFVGSSNGYKQAKFEKFTLVAPLLHTIPNYAFYELHNLRYVTVRSGRLSRVEGHAFDFEMPANHMLHVDLQYNKLSAGSFEFGSFLETKRPVHLMLMYNEMSGLERDVFEPILSSDTRNVIDLSGNPLVCDCRMAWIIRDRDLYEKQLRNAYCRVNGSAVDVWSLDEHRYVMCNKNGNYNYTPELIVKSSMAMKFSDNRWQPIVS